MKTAIIFTDGIKQIVFTPENEQETMALSMMDVDDNIEMLVKNGTFGISGNVPFSASVDECKGGYLRLFQDEKSRILVLKPKKPVEKIKTFIADDVYKIAKASFEFHRNNELDDDELEKNWNEWINKKLNL